MRAPRFSLRLLFILTTLCAGVLGYIVWFEAPCYNPRQQEQEKLCSDLEAMGFLPHLHEWEELPPPPFAGLFNRKQGYRLAAIKLSFESRTKYTSKELRTVFEQLDRESSIDRIECDVDIVYGVRKFASFSLPNRTTAIRLFRVEVDQTFVDEILKLKRLRKIELSDVSFNSTAPSKTFGYLFSNLPASVTELDFGSQDIPFEVAELIGAHCGIESLVIGACDFTSAEDYPVRTIPAASISPHCKRLSLVSMMIDRPLCEQIARCHDLQRLDLASCIFDGTDYQSPMSMVIENLPASVEELMLPRFSLSQNDLQSLAKLKSLRELTLTYDGTEVSKDDIRRLSKSLTKLELETDIPEQWLAALVDHPQFEEISIHTDRTLPDTICDVILKVNPKKFIYSGRMLSAKARQRLLDARVDDNGSDDEYPSFGSSGGW